MTNTKKKIAITATIICLGIIIAWQLSLIQKTYLALQDGSFPYRLKNSAARLASSISEFVYWFDDNEYVEIESATDRENLPEYQ